MESKHLTEQIDVDVPVSVAYNQWTQFEEFPRFMEDVEAVRQIDDRTLEWRAKIAGKNEEWTAEIIEQEPDRRIAWQAVAGKGNSGTIDFEPQGANRCRVRARIEIRPDTATEKIGSLFGVPQRALRADLEHFKEYIESRGRETGAWRGEIPSTGARGEGTGVPTRRP